MPTRRERKWDRAQFIYHNRPAYYLAPFKRPKEWRDPLGALAWDQTEQWMTPREWLDRLRRSGRPYKVYGKLTGNRWAPRPRPCISAHWYPASTEKRGWLPDSERGRRE